MEAGAATKQLFGVPIDFSLRCLDNSVDFLLHLVNNNIDFLLCPVNNNIDLFLYPVDNSIDFTLPCLERCPAVLLSSNHPASNEAKASPNRQNDCNNR